MDVAWTSKRRRVLTGLWRPIKKVKLRYKEKPEFIRKFLKGLINLLLVYGKKKKISLIHFGNLLKNIYFTLEIEKNGVKI